MKDYSLTLRRGVLDGLKIASVAESSGVNNELGFIDGVPSIRVGDAWYPLYGTGDNDPYWDQVISYLRFNGPDVADFTDEKGLLTWTRANANVGISTEQSAFSSASLKCNGGYLSTPSQELLRLGTSPFTIELMVRPTGSQPGAGWYPSPIFHQRPYPESDRSWSLTNSGDYSEWEFSIQFGTTWYSVVCNRSFVPYNAWTHLAFTRDGDVLRMFTNGVLRSWTTLPTNASVPLANKPMLIGAGAGQDNNTYKLERGYRGFIDMVRITKACRYVADFTPPSAEFPVG